MSAKNPLHCPHCGEVVPLSFFDHTNLRPGQLACPSCHRGVMFPLSVRLGGLIAALVVTALPMIWLGPLLSAESGEPLTIVLKGVAFVAAVAFLMVAIAWFVRGMGKRLEKTKFP